MKSKSIIYGLFIVFMTMGTFSMQGQNNGKEDFQGARATQKTYRVVFGIKEGNQRTQGLLLRNINAVLHDPRLQDKTVNVELVAYSAGIRILEKDSKFGDQLKKLFEQGVTFSACHNTMRGMKITKEDLYPFVKVVPSGVGEMVIRQQQGWALVVY